MLSVPAALAPFGVFLVNTLLWPDCPLRSAVSPETPPSAHHTPSSKSTQNRNSSNSSLAYSGTPRRLSYAPFSTSTQGSDTADWDHNPNLAISNFSELPSKDFGVNQHMIINQEFKEALRQILWQFRAPIRYAFAYGSGVFPQNGSAASSLSTHPSAPAAIKNMQQGSGKMIDFIFGVSYSQHWHSLNLMQHRDHYSGLGSLGSYAVSQVQDRFGAGVYFNTHVTVNGTLINTAWSTWTLYLKTLPSGIHYQPIIGLRVALLLLPERFTEFQLYNTIAGISYMGDLRMVLAAEDPGKVHNIVSGQMTHFRRLYEPLISNLPNVDFNDPRCSQSDWVDDPNAVLSMQQAWIL
ncbi:Phosphatidate cytidylyltransferase [Penicillium chermesinum]|uniref:Phosphatidate cytidylyltransferase, mitochondrial n=1 Tax=Penicillium chermesinum TaxID=63820 RepID=A0A9W9PHR9_9EURO|nr:Phosphatidate cytidylyltransferase [Penicillium chermesinum]KAJ5247069.1 Phosphatidate cytidylyltransferase [Penicillium chermesinum]